MAKPMTTWLSYPIESEHSATWQTRHETFTEAGLAYPLEAERLGRPQLYGDGHLCTSVDLHAGGLFTTCVCGWSGYETYAEHLIDPCLPFTSDPQSAHARLRALEAQCRPEPTDADHAPGLAALETWWA